MCTVSVIGDQYQSQFPPRWPSVTMGGTFSLEYATKSDISELKQEIDELRKLLIQAKKFDEATGQPDCEIDEKVAFIKQVAEMVGVDMDDVFAG